MIHGILFESEASPPSDVGDLQLIRHICQCVSRRAAAYLATALQALWKLHNDCNDVAIPISAPMTVGCHGSVILKYPGLFERCQSYLDPNKVILERAENATIIGAAIAAACADS